MPKSADAPMQPGTGGYRFGRFVLDSVNRRLTDNGAPVALRARPFDLLLVLLEHAGQLVSKDRLLDLAWPGLVVEENNLQVQISVLRRFLGPEAIATVPGRGYRLTLSMEGAATVARQSAPNTNSVTGGDAATGQSQAASTSRRRVAAGLPLHLPPLLGRESDLGQIKALILEHPLVTLVGAGGIGKTRLALAIAHELLDRYADGLYVVELTAVSDPAMVSVAVAQALSIRLEGGRAVQDVLVDAVRDQNLLLVLDNCEHLAESVAALAEALLGSSGHLSVLATSQEPLRLAKEHVYRVPTLAVPDVSEGECAASYGAVALFIDRARAADPHFALTAENTPAVIEVCRRLDGIALAIELAAARVALLGAGGLRDRLSERFRLLKAGPRFTLPRHQTLQATLDWSHGLLSVAEQKAFRRLAVFAGGFTMQSAQELASDGATSDAWAVLDQLGALVDKSLVVAETGTTPRYRFLETTRAYALEQLARAGESDALLQRHADIVRRIFERAEEDRFGERGSINMDALIQRLQPEFDNLRAALGWTSERRGNVSTAIALAAASAETLGAVGLATEGLKPLVALRHLVDESTDPQLAGRFWYTLAYLGRDGLIANDAVLEAIANAERIYRRLDSPRRLYRTLVLKAWTLAMRDRAAEAEGHLPEILRLEDPSWPGWLRANRLNLQGFFFSLRNQHEPARAVYQEWRLLLPASGEERSWLNSIVNECDRLCCMEQFANAVSLSRLAIERCRSHRLESDMFSFALVFLVSALTASGLVDDARKELREAVPYWRRDGVVIYFCEHVALLFAKLGRYADAARLAGAREAHRQFSGSVMHPNEVRSRTELLKCFAAARLDREDVERWMQEGAHLDVDTVAALCLDDTISRL